MGQGSSSNEQEHATETESESDKKHPDNKKMSGDGWTDIREKKRGCTDCLCLVCHRG